MTDEAEPGFLLTHRRLKLDTLVRLRWLAVGGQTMALLVVHLGLGYPLPVAPAFALVALSAWVNVFLKIRSPSTLRLSDRSAAMQLGYDILQMCGLLYLTGGLGNPFAFLLLAPVMVSATGLSGRLTLALGTLATVCATLLAFFHLPLPWPVGADFSLPPVYSIGIWIALVCSLAFMAAYAYRVAEEARQLADALAASELVLAREHHLNALDGLAAAAAHELGTPLATIFLTAKELTREFDSGDPRAEDVALIRSQAERCRDILRQLTTLSSDRDMHFQRMSMAQLIEEVSEPHRGFGIAIKVSMAGEGAEPIGSRNPAIRYGLGNLLENAVDFARKEVQISCTWDSRTARITISDDGPGFSADVLSRIGEPYVSARGPRSGAGATGGGLGLGFFIAKTLLERTGARVSFENRTPPETGAIVRISWPRASIEAAGNMDPARDSGHNSRIVSGSLLP
ncbi:ActS/PrrB/RegB family redox-sensitive histidine kinase [Microvirga tunisiensis]|uniref:histidine kinase n=2 Tax=Pannonibacter tanglangensis TaxID=2750084 RepID=A0A7X5F5Y8_9HYPH|nr:MULTISPECIES: ActS/PrrB/RegB family redox-sensitive histidine kinase [unclassified Pannonibacter]NBN65654.1 ActS/PrrB/RegB family redox-sensitive histidine kinase [Pannonibacter sp. XCT-34]NBN80119.1 ActS/PrrB/RegB family redox-sensitive histidine kinase [Pannonibacter sp. XCT-53]